MTTIHQEKTQGVLRTALTPQTFDIVRGMPGRHRWKGRDLYFELTKTNSAYLKEHFPDAQWSSHMDEQLDKWDTRKEEEQQAILDKRRELNLPSFQYKTTPYAHQEKAFFLSRDRKAFGFFMEMGTGKSKVVCDTAAYLFAAGEIDAMLLVSPNGVHRQWLEEQVPIHLPDWCPRQTLIYRSPSKQTKGWLQDFTALQAAEATLRILSMHIDALSSPGGQKNAEQFLTASRTLMILDESTRIKTPKATRTKATIKLGEFASHRRILSGAPVTKGVEDLFSQLKFLDPDVLGFSSYWSFKAHFCELQSIPGAPRGATKIVGYKNLDELTTALDGNTFRVTKEDCLDLPDKIYLTREIELSKEQKKAYAELRDDLMTQLADGTIVDAPLAITKLMKMQQVLCGFLQPEEGPWQELPNNRISETLQILAETRGKVIIWARYRADLKRLADALKSANLGYSEYHGGVSSDQRAINLRKFKESNDCRVFLAQPQSGGTGLNLAVANTAIYFSNDFNADTRWQSEDRIHRIGQTNHCTYIDLVVPRSIDTKILAALKAKKNVADSVIDVTKVLED